METEIAILLGAGSSVAAGFPTTNELTCLVLSGQGVTRHSDGAYYIGDNDEPPRVVLKLVKHTVTRLREEASRYAGRAPNYEDLFYLAHQASDEESGTQTENPDIRRFVDELRAEMSPRIQAENSNNQDTNEPYEPHLPNDFRELLCETCNYISDVVSQRLRRMPESIRQPAVIEDACNSFRVASISTLCHDTHLEMFLKRSGIALFDGFSEAQPDCPSHWNCDLTSDRKTLFLKLHGSVDWFRYPDGQIIRFPPDCYPQRMKSDGGIQYAEDGRSRCLVGTLNKLEEYSTEMFCNLHSCFRSTISAVDRLVICGYSFGDKGINERIIEWIRGGESRRFVIIDPHREDLKTNACDVMKNDWDMWEKNESIKIIPKRLECVDIDDLKEAICP